MNVEEMIRDRLSGLAPESLEVFDDSHEHAGHAGAKDGQAIAEIGRAHV